MPQFLENRLGKTNRYKKDSCSLLLVIITFVFSLACLNVYFKFLLFCLNSFVACITYPLLYTYCGFCYNCLLCIYLLVTQPLLITFLFFKITEIAIDIVTLYYATPLNFIKDLLLNKPRNCSNQVSD